MSRKKDRRPVPSLPGNEPTPQPQGRKGRRKHEYDDVYIAPEEEVIEEELYTNMDGTVPGQHYPEMHQPNHTESYSQSTDGYHGYPAGQGYQDYHHQGQAAYQDDQLIYENFDGDIPNMMAPPVPVNDDGDDDDDDDDDDEEEQKEISPEKAKEMSDLRNRLSMMMKLRIPPTLPQPQTQPETEFTSAAEAPVPEVSKSSKPGARDSMESGRSSGYSTGSSSSANSLHRSSDAETEEYYTNMPLHTITPGRPYVPPIEEEEEPDPYDLNRQEYYVKDAGRDAVAEAIESVKQEGCFLLRNSPSGGTAKPYTLGLYYGGKVWNLQVQVRGRGFALGSEKPQEFTCSTVAELIEYYRTHDIVLAKAGKFAGTVRLKSSPALQ